MLLKMLLFMEKWRGSCVQSLRYSWTMVIRRLQGLSGPWGKFLQEVSLMEVEIVVGQTDKRGLCSVW